jgi:hypothetical protein
VWINPLEKKYLSEDDSRLLFSNIAIIKQFNENLLKQLQERMKNWNDETTLIGDIFVQLVISTNSIIFQLSFHGKITIVLISPPPSLNFVFLNHTVSVSQDIPHLL